MSGLLSPELLANIGKTSAPRLELVTRKDIRKYAIATQQRDRRFLDGDEAPPMFYLALFWPVPENDQLSPDGVAIDPLLPEFPLKRAMAGGLHIDYHRSIHPGDVLQATREGRFTGRQVGDGQQRAPIRRQLGFGGTTGGLFGRVDEIAHLLRRMRRKDRARHLLHDQDGERRPQARTENLVPLQIAAHARPLQ